MATLRERKNSIKPHKKERLVNLYSQNTVTFQRQEDKAEEENAKFLHKKENAVELHKEELIKNRKRKRKRESGGCRFSLFDGKLTIHPLFLLFGVWYAISGELLPFLSITACALLHELAHASVAARIGYATDNIVLMPYGATLTADLDGATAKDEILIALAGPLSNFIVAVGFLALWWCFPSTYPYTEIAYTTSISLAVCNLLPALPLDGGRVVHRALIAWFERYFSPQKARKIALTIGKIITSVCCLLGVAVFLLSVFVGEPNFSVLAFSLFLAAGVFTRNRSSFVKLNFSQHSAFDRGIPLKQIALSSTCTVKKSLTFLSPDSYLLLHIYDERERFLGTITQNELSKFFAKTGLYATLGEYFAIFA
jgi:stage IV sporulation protein FB